MPGTEIDVYPGGNTGMESVLKIAVLCAALLIGWQATKQPPAPHESPALSRETAAHPSNPRLRDGPYRGMAVQLHGGTDVYDRYRGLIPEIADLGADTVLFVVHGWQEHGGSLDLHIHPRKTASPHALGLLCDDARAAGLDVILMPIVLLEHPRNKEWRGRIVPEGHNWDEWFRRYTRFIVHFARIAEEHRVAVLMVGSELIKTEAYTDRWVKVIEEVRQNYRGALGYSANWDHYQPAKIGFWPQLDCVGMTTYYELASGPNPEPEEVDRNWSRFKKEILAFQAEIEKPIIFTEVGWCSQEGAAHEGWNYYANQKATPQGHREQTLLYEAFIRAWGAEPAVGGIIWWEWNDFGGGMDDFNYTPRGKPAEAVLRKWFADTAPGS